MPEPSRPSSIVSHGATLPPPRPGVRYVKVRWLGVVVSDDRLRRRVERRFYRPMIILALLVLPLFVMEVFFLREESQWKGSWLDTAISIGIAVIWLAFLIEFVVKVAIAECRVEYCKRNWLDIIIIMAPMLRVLRVAKIARTTKVFTLRGVGMKFARYVITVVIGLEATERILHRVGIKAKKKRRDPDDMTRYQLTREVRNLRKLTDAWETWYEEHESYLDDHGRPDGAFEVPVPREVAVFEGGPEEPEVDPGV